MILKNAKIVTEKKVIENGYLVIQNKKITKVCAGTYQGEDQDVYDMHGNILMPGFIDLHIHGSGGYDFMDANEEQLQTIANSLYQEGTTSFLATTLTADIKSLLRVSRSRG